ncbi:uncharacterized protein LOC111373423 [Olea europaea var. sylvestris]|uniref:uncharacterized protein LOC111373423 n=1 Tax=Olea europaea var. sylvestris TaxID=158386 RepID=UPI000C1D8AF9|nr:uncharacterized protein LOC111373423 [Olea europaea var. sylvestris]
MHPPPGFLHPPNKVSKLQHAFPYDSALFIRCTDNGIVLLVLYVVDMIITGDDAACISQLQQYLNQQFEMKDLGPLRYFLGLEVSSNSDGYYLSLAKYASDLLSQTRITDNKTVSTPLEPNVKLTPVDVLLSMILLSITNFSLGQSVYHRSSHISFLYYSSNTSLCEVDSLSWTSFFISLFSNTFWRSKKQIVTTCSSTESEYRTLADATAKLL